jgi:polysaccharide export outer membrane protein
MRDRIVLAAWEKPPLAPRRRRRAGKATRPADAEKQVVSLVRLPVDITICSRDDLAKDMVLTKSHFTASTTGRRRSPSRSLPCHVPVSPGLRVSLVALTLLAGCATTGRSDVSTPPAAPNRVAAVPDRSQGTPGPAADNTSTYVIGPGDSLYIFVYDSPQLSLDVPVRPDGRISTPLIPEMIAAGKTPSQLAKDLTQRLKQYVKDPNVTVIVRGFVGPLNRQIRVIGEAAEPQAIPYRDHMTVLDVMIMTKGLTRYAAGNRAVIVRRVGGRQETIHVHLSDLLKDGDINENVELQPGDTLIIPQAWF